MALRGQPTKYDPKYCEMVIEHMSQGLSVEAFAGIIAVCKDTVYEWAKVHEDFSDAIKVGKSKRRVFFERLGIDGMMGNLKNFSAAAWIFHMKCREGYKEDTEENKVPIKIELVKRAN
jgi:hypothetical protein